VFRSASGAGLAGAAEAVPLREDARPTLARQAESARSGGGRRPDGRTVRPVTSGGATYVASERIGRNDPCHCGSGRKFKRCHGAE